jgi:hypothetical protein
MKPDIHKDVTRRIIDEFKFVDEGNYLRKGICKKCNKKELYTPKDNPWILRCGRVEKCGWEASVRDLYKDIFDSWSTRYPRTDKEPNAAADAYLTERRGFSLKGMKGCYTQETYHDNKLNMTSATVRFPLPGGGYWERIIDQPGRFGKKKANFAYGKSYGGHVWNAPDQPLAELAKATDIWIVEGIFDAWALREAGLHAVTPLTCTNYPKIFLDALRKECGAQGLRTPRLVWAFDIGKAGTEATRKFHARSTDEGWRATAAQPRAEGETVKVDWNDLHERDLLTTIDPRTKKPWIETYLWHGQVLLAEGADEKALLLWERNNWGSFYFVFKSRTYWATFDKARISEMVDKEGVTEKFAASRCSVVDEIANCAFRILYAQRGEDEKDLVYYLAVDRAGTDQTEKQQFPSSAVVSSSKFKESLFGAAAGAQYLGSTFQLDRIVADQVRQIKTVETLDFTGYSVKHGAWILGDLAVKDGNVYSINDEDYFDFGKDQVKLKARERLLKHVYDSDKFDFSWFEHVWKAWGPKGVVVTTFWIMSFFATQLRAEYQGMGYLEMSGPHGTGKSTIILFLWKLAGLMKANYEGIDPSKSTMVGYIRTLTQTSNLPVIFVEGDRSTDNPHTKKFDWDEIKALFNGQTGRATGKKTNDTQTNDPPFRGALIIEQNRPINADKAVLSRITQTKWTKDGWNETTKVSVDKIKAWPRDDLSGAMIHIITREKTFLAAMREVYPTYEAGLRGQKIRDDRVITNHALIHAGLEGLAKLIKIPERVLSETHAFIDAIASERDLSIESDHEVVAKFWEKFDFIDTAMQRTASEGKRTGLNHHNKADYIAISLSQFEAECRRIGVSTIDEAELKKHLKTSKSRPFVEVKTVNSAITKGPMHCWVFRTELAAVAA